MFAQFYSGMRWTDLPLLALFIFVATFVAAVVRIMFLTKRSELEAVARLPLHDEIVTKKEVLRERRR